MLKETQIITISSSEYTLPPTPFSHNGRVARGDSILLLPDQPPPSPSHPLTLTLLTQLNHLGLYIYDPVQHLIAIGG
jgi:hypothetical protein